ncbi:ACP S-malonyltransferase [Lentzea sp. BCCO 10_0061]|uniref:[acyl-carrier-protein] S-malonyltransferase n=1 Tax=Lentzea sokolovensis TaxID=3095429 RepID=A0ABU4V8C6_9PSEU|nr:ACP S-malonyltransferase [Lentzea sp. BCCO 10_0061]MDX8147211.1 ACP S-malonyltransferase [Lentzea sp. BCCO 10_0061]
MSLTAVIFPGQGAQAKGMGRDLFDAYPDEVDRASELLGYSVRELCLDDPRRELKRTEFTQPALFVVGALAHRRWQEHSVTEAAFFAGHSLGEYCALHAAGAFDFETGVRLVQRRGELMAGADGGGMIAVTGLDREQVTDLLRQGGFGSLVVANDNSPEQCVVSGDAESIESLGEFLRARNVRWVRLRVSGAFHSELMRPAREEFSRFLDGVDLGTPRTPVIANVTAAPYQAGDTAKLLSDHLVSPVRWTETVRYLLDAGVTEFVELGGTVLTKLVERTRATHRRPAGQAQELGSATFRERHGLRFAYVAGGMYRGVSSPEMVIRLSRAGMLGFYGTGGLDPVEVERGIKEIQAAVGQDGPYGVNFIANHDDPASEQELVDLLLRHHVRTIEASAFIQMTPALVRYRATGLRRGPGGAPICDHRVVAKVSRPEVAAAFLAPPPDAVLDGLLTAGAIGADQAELARRVPMSHDVIVEADSGGHTDGGIATVLLPSLLELRRRVEAERGYDEPICMGLAGGIGTPAAVAAAFVLGADFVVTGSINQCTLEAATSDVVKDMLQDIDVQDTDYAPAGDMFELGSRVQVLRKGVFFPARGNKLHALYSQYGSLDDLPEKTRSLLERTYFRKPLDEVWADVERRLRATGRAELADHAAKQPKQKMALVFRRYFGYSARIALEGRSDDKVNYQVHTGPALGSFNQWVRDSPQASWRHRHVDEVGRMLLDAAATHLGEFSGRTA